MSDRAQIEAAIAALQALRSPLGDAVIDVALQPSCAALQALPQQVPHRRQIDAARAAGQVTRAA